MCHLPARTGVKNEFLISRQRDVVCSKRWHLLSDYPVESLLDEVLRMQALLQCMVVSPSSCVFSEGGAGPQH